MTDKMQELMNRAYDRWHNRMDVWTTQDFWDQLNADERFAVFLGNLNYQVENGGFSQWWSNGYATPETFGYIKRACTRIGTNAAKKVAKLVKTAEKAIGARTERELSESEWEDLIENLSELDKAFYAVNAQFMQDAEAHLEKGEV